MRRAGQRRGQGTAVTVAAQGIALLGGSLAWMASASARDRPKAYLEAAGELNVGLYGLASGLHPGVHVGAGIRFPYWSFGLAGSYATIKPGGSHYAYSIVCSQFLDRPCSEPVLGGTFVSVDAVVRLHPLRLLRIEPYVEGFIGWNTVSLSDPAFGLIGQTTFSMQGFHLGAAAGAQYHLTGFLGVQLSLGYGWSVVEQPEDVLSGGGTFTDLLFIDNHAHQFRITLGLQLQL